MDAYKQTMNIKFEAYGPEPYMCKIKFDDFNFMRDTIKQQRDEIEKYKSALKECKFANRYGDFVEEIVDGALKGEE